MTQQTKIAASAIISRDLSKYKLSRKQKGFITAWEKMNEYMKLANKSATSMRLGIADYNDLAAAVRNQSDGKRDLSELTYKGVPILSIERSPQMDMLA